MIYKGSKGELVGVYRKIYRNYWLSATAIYKGARLVWMAIRSCFGAGFWINEKPWLNSEAWKN